MNNWKKVLKRGYKEPMGSTIIFTEDTLLDILNESVQQVLEQIEEARLSELGNVIEKLKEEYK